jgi:hypothetical protein
VAKADAAEQATRCSRRSLLNSGASSQKSKMCLAGEVDSWPKRYSLQSVQMLYFLNQAMSKYTRAEIGTILDDELRTRRAAYLRAKMDFNTAMSGPSGLPQPDGILHIKNVSAAYVVALQGYTTAMGKHSRFIAKGYIPVRFAEPK